MDDWRNTICQTVGVERIGNINNYVVREPISSKTPIDIFYEETRYFLSVVTPVALADNEWIGPLYTTAIISSTENYLRDILSKTLKICCDSQKHAASNNINFGSVIWHPISEIERGAFEHLSLASSENICGTTKKFTGIDLKKKGLNSILEEYDKICELRHGIVHSGRTLAGKNGIKLKLLKSTGKTKISIQYAELQEISSVCTTLVVSINKLIFETMIMRWATTWRQSPNWVIDNEKAVLKELWNNFRSKIDYDNGTVPLSCTWVKCYNLAKKEYNL